jgi:predicted DsbA family dithiol-disulfide isomerase
MYGNCPECKSLSANLSEATKSYFAILAAIQLAIDANNTALVSELEAPKLAAQEKRGKARHELRQHEATHPKATGQTA